MPFDTGEIPAVCDSTGVSALLGLSMKKSKLATFCPHFILPVANLILLAAGVLFMTLPLRADSGQYMHNVRGRGTPVDIAQLVSPEDSAKCVEEADAEVDSAVRLKRVVKLDGISALSLSGRVVDNDFINQNNGRTIRFYIWVNAEGVKADGNLWGGSPSVRFFLNDDYGNVSAEAFSLFKTRGTYPWHCYYVDFVIPKNFQLKPAEDGNDRPAAGRNVLEEDEKAMLKLIDDGEEKTAGRITESGLYMELSCAGGGIARFGGLNYEVLQSNYAARREAMLDKASGTYAPNPQYDELPMMLFYGLEKDVPWNFLSGNNSFPNLKTIAGLREYVGKNAGDWFQMQCGIARLPYLFVTSRALSLADGFEDGWLEVLRDELNALQDTQTGLWKSGGRPNVAVTNAIVKGCYSPRTLTRSDVKQSDTPWSAAGNEVKLHDAGKIIETLLSCRVEGTAAWNCHALQDNDPAVEEQKSFPDLATTSAAVELLSRCADCFTPADRQYSEAHKAIREAWYYCVDNFLMPDNSGSWRDNPQSIRRAASGAHMLEIIEASRLLESRINSTLAAPKVMARHEPGDRGQIGVFWEGKENGVVALRVYCAAADTNKELLTDKNLIGIIEKNPGNLRAADPYLVVRKIVDAAMSNYKMTAASAGTDYINAKMKIIPDNLSRGIAGKKTIVQPPGELLYQSDGDTGAHQSLKFYAAAVNSYGELSPFTEIQVADSTE